MKKTALFYLLSCLLGLLVGLVAAAFKILILNFEKIYDLLSSLSLPNYLELLLSLVITLIFTLIALTLVHRYAKEAKGSGVPEIEGRLLGLRPLKWRTLIPVKLLGSSLGISAHMILGREGPTIQMGGNLGGMLAEKCQLSKSKTDILIGAGAAAGLAAAFNAPLAGVLFILEEMRQHFKLTVTSFKSVMITCIMATLVVNLCFGSETEIHMHHFESPPLWTLSFFFIFGLILGISGLLFNRSLLMLLQKTSHFTFKKRICYTLIAAITIGIIHQGEPNLVGGGYQIIQESLQLNFSIKLLMLVLFTRLILTLFCYSTGLHGGLFAPLLAIGTLMGVTFGSLLLPFIGETALFPRMFAVVGMAGLFSACIQAPITGIILVVEMTGNYQLIFPLMITCITSTAIVQLANEPSLYHCLLQNLLKEK